MPDNKRIKRVEANEEEIEAEEYGDEEREYDAETHSLLRRPKTLEDMEAESVRFLNYMNNRTETAMKLAKKKGWKPSVLSSLVKDQEFRNDIMSKLFIPLFENGISRINLREDEE